MDPMDSTNTMDARISEWVNLVNLDSEGTAVVIGDPPPGTIEGVARYFEKIVLVPAGKRNNVDNKIIETRLWLGEGKLPLRDKEAAVVAVFPGFDYQEDIGREIVRSIRTSGDIVIFSGAGTREPARFIRGIRPSREYAVVPGMQDPRWILPLRPGRVAGRSLDLYQPSRTGARVKKLAFRFLARTGFARIVAEDRFRHFRAGSEPSPSRLEDRASEILGRPRVCCSLFTGTPPAGRKVTAQLMDENGEVLGYGKMSPDPRVFPLLENERDCLTRLNSWNPESFIAPGLLHFGDLGRVKALFQAVPPGKPSPGPEVMRDVHVDVMVELYKLSGKKLNVSRSRSLSNIEARLEGFAGKVRADRADLLREGLDRVRRELNGSDALLGLAHGDFTPWNTRVHRGRLYVFDWEWARSDAPPFQDLYHFEISRRIFVEHEDAGAIWEGLHGDPFKKYLAGFAGRAGVKESLADIALVWMLVDDISWYLAGYVGENLPVPEDHEYINKCGELLRRALGHGS